MIDIFITALTITSVTITATGMLFMAYARLIIGYWLMIASGILMITLNITIPLMYEKLWSLYLFIILAFVQLISGIVGLVRIKKGKNVVLKQ